MFDASSKPVVREYIVSEDVDILLPRWARDFGLCLPSLEGLLQPARRRLHQALSLEGIQVVQVSSKTIEDGMAGLVKSSRFPVVSMDPVYCRLPLELQLTRVINEYDDALADWKTYPSADHLQPRMIVLRDGKGLKIGSARSADPIREQMRRIANVLAPTGQTVIAIADDVVFTGGCIKRMVEGFHEVGIEVGEVIAGIGATLPGNKTAAVICSELGIDFRAVVQFPTTDLAEVVDEICERDFFIGVPMSGRTFFPYQDGCDVGFPYIYPFGNMRDWAGISKNELEVARQLIAMNIEFWRQIGSANGRDIVLGDLARIPLDRTNKPIKHPKVEKPGLVFHLEAFLEDLG